MDNLRRPDPQQGRTQYQSDVFDPAAVSSDDLRPSHATGRIGVLFVHGIGEQSRGDTLLKFGEPLSRFLEQWISPGDGTLDSTHVQVQDAVLVGEAEADQPPRVHVTATIDKSPDSVLVTDWLLAESWWARSFKGAQYREVARFAMQVAPALVYRTVMESKSEPDDADKTLIGSSGYWIRRIWSAVEDQMSKYDQWSTDKWLNSLAFVVVLILQAALLSLLVVGLFPPARALATSAQRRLAGVVGDSYILVTSPLRRSAMIARVLRDIDWLAERCDRVVIVAHSQGAAVAHGALKQRVHPKLFSFVTLGAGIDKLFAVERLATGSPRLQRGVMLVNIGLIGFGVACWALWMPIPAGLMPFRSVLVWGGVIATLCTWPFAFRDLMVPLVRPGANDLSLAHSGEEKLSWLDFHAKADLVPHGALLTPSENLDADDDRSDSSQKNYSVEVRNYDSPISDHTSYFDNPEEVLAPIVNMLSRAGQGTDLVPTDVIRRGIHHRKHRMEVLNSGRLGYVFSAAAVLVALGNDRLVRLGQILGGSVVSAIGLLFPDLSTAIRRLESSETTVPWVLGLLATVSAMLLIYQVLVLGPWKTWHRSAAAHWFLQGGEGDSSQDDEPGSVRARLAVSASVPVVVACGFCIWLFPGFENPIKTLVLFLVLLLSLGGIKSAVGGVLSVPLESENRDDMAITEEHYAEST